MNRMTAFKNIFVSPLIVSFLLFSVPARSSENITEEDMKNYECEKVAEVREWLGKKLSQAVKELGAFSNEETFDMNEVVINEFRGNLEVLFPLSTRGKESKWIKEASWNQGNCILTLWFEKQSGNWVVVDTLRWYKDREF